MARPSFGISLQHYGGPSNDGQTEGPAQLYDGPSAGGSMTPHDLLANFQTLVEAPKGIQRLRELVLELAVRGKLVNQDPGDEPADALMACLRKERAKLVREGRIRAGRTLADLKHVDCPFVVPKGWAVCRMTDLGFFLGGKTPSTNVGAYWNGTIPWVSPKDMKVPLIEDTEDHVSQKAIEDGLPQIPQGSVLIVVRSGILRRMVPVAITLRDSTINQDLKALWPFPSAKADYIALMIKGFESYILEYLTKTGTTVESIKFEEFSAHPFLFPPEREQRRIVARVDELMALLDRLEAKCQDREAARTAARDSALSALREAPTPDDIETAWLRIQERFHELFATPEDVEPLRQAILQLAVAGRLVPQNPNDTSAAASFRGIQECRRQLIKAGKMRAGKLSQAISDVEIPFQPPLGWVFARLGDLLSDIQPGWSPQCEGRPRVGAEWGVLKVSACSWGRFLPEENKALPAGMEVPLDIEVQPGDWIISRANTTELVGRSVLSAECPPHLLLSDKTLRLVPMPGFSPRWGNLVNHAPSSRAHYAAKAGGTSASMRNISQDVIRSLVIAIPPIEEQERIHSKFEALMAILERLVGSLSSERNLASTFAAAAVHHLED